jgi:hypothetical protein
MQIWRKGEGKITSNRHHPANRVHSDRPGPASQYSRTAVSRFGLLGRECGLAATKRGRRAAASCTTIPSVAVRPVDGLLREESLEGCDELVIGRVAESGGVAPHVLEEALRANSVEVGLKPIKAHHTW